MLQATAHAKINLALHVTGKREDGYHLLDSLVVFSEYGDQLTISAGSDAPISLEINGPFSKGLPIDETNLVYKAASLLANAASEHGIKISPIHIKLEKNLPVASGIGGGSADAAAVLKALSEFWNLEEKIDLFELAKQLGADVPMCLHSRPLRAQGIGEDITALKMLSPLYMVLVNPLVEVSTPEIFKQLKSKENEGVNILLSGMFPSLDNLHTLRNDLQEPAMKVEPAISHTLNALKSSQSILTRMSGSGATCFGIYEDEKAAQNAYAEIRSENPNWWCIATTSIV